MMDVWQNFERWQRLAVEDPDLQVELEALARAGDEEELRERFGSDLAFGTGGLRGVLGAGTARMNVYTVRRATQGLADWLRVQGDMRPVAIAYDSRIKSDRFAREAARVLAGNGFSVWLYPRPMPTPTLSFAVRRLGCSAGICVTASHNPACYNGYKVFRPDGAQVTVEQATAIAEQIQKVDPFEGVRLAGFAAAQEEGRVCAIPEEVVDAFIEAVLAVNVAPKASNTPLRVVYTPLNGTGTECVMRVLHHIGVEDIRLVAQQTQPDGNFPTCPLPNPENSEAMELGTKLLQSSGADLLLATDPDCDRVGVAVLHEGTVHELSGNEVGVLLLDFLCALRRMEGTLPPKAVAVDTIVTTDMAGAVAQKYGVTLHRVLTGFKYIGEQINRLEEAGEVQRFVLGFEESCGYLAGSYVRDKDGVGACMLVCEMARWYKSMDMTLVDALGEMYKEHGYFYNTQHSVEYAGAQGRQAMQAVMRVLRAEAPTAVAGIPVLSNTDYRVPTEQQGYTLPTSDVLAYRLEGGANIHVRPSGTEPKLKLYIETVASGREAAIEQNEQVYGGMQELLQAANPVWKHSEKS